MRDLDDLFQALGRSAFRSRFRLGAADASYLADKGLETVLGHARRFLAERLAPAAPIKDGSQTPMRGHPVFVAQHATGSCCRSCLAKWHRISPGRAMTEPETEQVVAAIGRWLAAQDVPPPEPRQPRLL